MGVTFPGSQNVTMYDNALSLVDFASSGQQFRGTIEHEFSHALIEPIQTGQNRTMIDDFADAMDFWDGINLSNYWQDDVNGILDAPATRNDAGLQNVECPITDYGMTNAQEDLAEAMMFFFEDPAKLQSDCPERFTFIADNIGQYLNQEYMQGTIDPLRNPQPVN
jgi:hypothetical protein